MFCPVGKIEVLVLTDRQGKAIDDGPSCIGGWLDGGEWDKRDMPATMTASRLATSAMNTPRPTGRLGAEQKALPQTSRTARTATAGQNWPGPAPKSQAPDG